MSSGLWWSREIYLSEYLIQSYITIPRSTVRDGLGLHHHPAVHDEYLSGYVGGEVRREKSDYGGDVLCGSQSFKCNLFAEGITGVGRHGCSHLGFDESRSYRVDENVARP